LLDVRAPTGRRKRFTASASNMASKNLILTATLGNKCVDPDSRQIETAAFTAMPDVK
jgi:hypothetical protein